jgi:hypothetical protein
MYSQFLNGLSFNCLASSLVDYLLSKAVVSPGSISARGFIFNLGGFTKYILRINEPRRRCEAAQKKQARSVAKTNFFIYNE